MTFLRDLPNKCKDESCELSVWPHVHEFQEKEPSQLAKDYIASGNSKHDAYIPFCYNCNTKPELVKIYGCAFGEAGFIKQELFYCNDHFDSGQRKLVMPFSDTIRLDNPPDPAKL